MLVSDSWKWIFYLFCFGGDSFRERYVEAAFSVIIWEWKVGGVLAFYIYAPFFPVRFDTSCRAEVERCFKPVTHRQKTRSVFFSIALKIANTRVYRHLHKYYKHLPIEKKHTDMLYLQYSNINDDLIVYFPCSSDLPQNRGQTPFTARLDELHKIALTWPKPLK